MRWREHEHLLQDVALLMLENSELEEDTTHLIVENYEMAQSMAAMRERNMADVSEENNQLFHDVAMLTLENCQMQETNRCQAEENRNMLQTIAELGDRQPPASHGDVSDLRSRMSTLQEENTRLKYKYETLKGQKPHHVCCQGQVQRDNQCLVS